MIADGSEPAILARVDDALGHLTLNRPQTINALTLEMIRSIEAALDAWETRPDISVVLLDGAGERGFCAGGDIRALYEAARSGNPMPRIFWREEYKLNARIARYSKPIVAVMDGIVMGGGVGLAAHASHRVASDRLVTAMPETGIGFAPDVGGTYFLSRAPGELGTHLALTGDRIGAADAILCGLADIAIDSPQRERLAEELRAGDVLSALAAAALASVPMAPGPLATARQWIDACYDADSVEEILQRLRERSEPSAVAAAVAIESKSPTSLKVTLRALRLGRNLPTLESCLDQEYRVSCAFLDTPDFTEGIRAAVIDKDRAPRWQPPTLDAILSREVDRHFTSLGDDELGLAA